MEQDQFFDINKTQYNQFIKKMIEEPLYFAEQLDEITQIYIKTTYGNIFAKAVGCPGQPLIIVVHGSGPKNSSDQYSYLLHEYLVRVSYIQKFYIIGIDCPGYGKSKGSKQVIKTFPLQMFKQILTALNYKTYFAMFGHSQGGSAIFNAVHQDPSITQFLLMDRPVCGNIKRFNKFSLPTLLVYDIEDDGHPIWQGKLLFKQLTISEIYTYRNSQDPYYVPDNIWDLIISFIRRNSNIRKNIMSAFNRRYRINQHHSYSPQYSKNKNSPYKPIGILKNDQKSQKFAPRSTKNFVKQKNLSMDKFRDIQKEKQKQKEIMIVQEIDKSEIYSRMNDLEEFEDLPTNMNQPKIEESPEEAKKYSNTIFSKRQQIKTKSIKQKKQQEQIIDHQSIQQKQFSKKSIQKQQIKQQTKQIQKNQKIQKEKTENDQYRCAICYEYLFQPTQTNCRHNFCKKCIGQSYLVDQRCPLCRTKITTRTLNIKLKEWSLEILTSSQIQKKQVQLNKFEHMLKNIVFIEIGNNTRELDTKRSAFTKTKKKYMWELYVKQPKNFKFEEVMFNINMSSRDSKPVRITQAPFVFESRGTFSFTCEITIKPRNKQYGTITSIYRIDISPGNHFKMIAVKKKNN